MRRCAENMYVCVSESVADESLGPPETLRQSHADDHDVRFVESGAPAFVDAYEYITTLSFNTRQTYAMLHRCFVSSRERKRHNSQHNVDC